MDAGYSPENVLKPKNGLHLKKMQTITKGMKYYIVYCSIPNLLCIIPFLKYASFLSLPAMIDL